MTEEGSGGFKLSFTRFKPANSSPAILTVWSTAGHSASAIHGREWPFPDTTVIMLGVDFSVTEFALDLTKNDVVAAIPAAGNAMDGKLFGCLTPEQ